MAYILIVFLSFMNTEGKLVSINCNKIVSVKTNWLKNDIQRVSFEHSGSYYTEHTKQKDASKFHKYVAKTCKGSK